MKNFIIQRVPKNPLQLLANWYGVAVLASLLVVGCEQNPRQALQGTVTLDGEPLSKGQVRFVPQRGTQGPTAGGDIVNGRFSIPPEGATFAGNFEVQITAHRPSGVIRHDPDEGDYELSEQYLPVRYNEASELTAEVTAGGPNEFTFELESK